MGKLYLAPEILSGLGEDTFWTWAMRELGGIPELPTRLEPTDLVLHYSTKGAPAVPSQTVTLLWELYPEMAYRLGTKFRKRQKLIDKSLSARWATVPTAYSRAFYRRECDILPIAVNTDLFAPAPDKAAVRTELGLDPNGQYVFWSGSFHPMKGPDIRDAWAAEHPEYQLLIGPRDNPIPQEQLVKLMQASDGFLNTSRLVPLYMIDWECLAVDLPMIPAGGTVRDFSTTLGSREYVFATGWSRSQAVDTWAEYIDRRMHELGRDGR